MIEFWLNMDPAMKTFVAIGAVSSLVLTIQMVLALMGGAMEGVEADFDIGDGGEGGATGILSIRSIGAFFTGFGWTGAAAIQNGLGTGTATFAATIVGGIFLGLVVYLMSYLHSLREEGTLNYKNCIREVGTVYLPIPPNRKGMGQIEVMVQGRLRIVKCVTDHDKKIQNQAAVRVTELVDQQTLLVSPLEKESHHEEAS